MNRVERTGAGRIVVEMTQFCEVEETCFPNRRRKSKRSEATDVIDPGDAS
jgi:hypothetical protein